MIEITIRPVTIEDVISVTRLLVQLGYSASEDNVTQRLSKLEEMPEHMVYVAVLQDGSMVGWMHLYIYTTLLAEPMVMVGGLVVDADYRSQGIGRQLMAQAERWTKELGYETVYLKSNSIRERAHAFYRNLGYEEVKSQIAFRKTVG
ncbi:MAG: GNAT family N-acetyltransferase [Anaerolineae bacterium]|nr:GNAT family N-acetyltransferase [Anaerolineae bacterium]